MANAFWNRLVDQNSAGHISPEHFKASLLSLVGSGSLTLANVRTQYGLPVGTEAGDELTDLVNSVQGISLVLFPPGSGRRQLFAYVIDKMCSSARLSNSGLSPNPWDTGNKLRLEVRAVIVQEHGGTGALVGSMVSAS